MKRYQPPITITPRILNLVAEVSERVGKFSAQQENEQTLRLRRISRIRSIQGSLAIEGNTLSEKQITAILDGKRVIAPPREIQEVHNAIAAYDQLPKWQAHREKDLLSAHRCLMKGLLEEAGRYRRGGVGVMSGKKVIHMAPPADRVPLLMRNLLAWLQHTDQHPLISSGVFHYEFEFIHPFADGNGRLGRLWQTLILSHWHAQWINIPVESLVHQHQRAYYQAIRDSTKASDAEPFVVFMLQMIRDALQTTSPQVTPQVSPQVVALLKALKKDMTRQQLQKALKLADPKSFRLRYLAPALAAGFIEMTLPGKPNSRLQHYRLSEKGRDILR